MSARITDAQRQTVLRMLGQGIDRHTIASAVGLTPGQVSAIAAHVKMGTYTLPSEADIDEKKESPLEDTEKSQNMLRELHNLVPASGSAKRLAPVLVGIDAENKKEVTILACLPPILDKEGPKVELPIKLCDLVVHSLFGHCQCDLRYVLRK